MNAIALRVNELSVSLGGGQRVVDRVSFAIRPGEALGLVGESGCGKTMTALAMLGLAPPGAVVECRGVELNGRDISTLGGARRRALLGSEIAMVFQQPSTALDPVFTLGQQIAAVYRRHAGAGRAHARRAALEALAEVGFADPGAVAAAYPHELSGGMRQLGMIAMATVCRPAVVIADEPTTALDGVTRALILQQLGKLRNAHGTAVLLISHDLAVVRQTCTGVMVMYCGRVVEKSPCAALFAGPRHPYSAGLLACIPRIGGQGVARVRPIPGQVPPAHDLPSGCRFTPRCARASARCREPLPVIEEGREHAVACINPLP